MSYQKSFSEQLNDRSAPIWRWFAGYSVGLNILFLNLSLFSFFRPVWWADSNPFSMFSILTAAIVFLQITPFARSIFLGNKTAINGETDEYERLVTQNVMTSSYRATGLCMLFVLLFIMLSVELGDAKLTTVSGGYFLMWFTFMFFSIPSIYAAFAYPSNAGGEDA